LSRGSLVYLLSFYCYLYIESKHKSLLKRLLIGKSGPIAKAHVKIALLRGQLSLLCFLVVLVYIIFDSLQRIYILVPAYTMVAIVSCITIWLNRNNRSLASSLTFLLLISGMTYFFAVNDTSQSGVFVYFIMTALTSMVFFGYKYRRYVIFFCSFLVFLFLSAYLFPLPWFVLKGESMEMINAPQYREISFVINFLGGFFLCTSIVYFLMDLNFHSESEILQKNALLTKTNRELDRFVYSASHDLRAPLSSLLGLIDVAQKRCSREEVDYCLLLMKDRVHNMDLFIKEIVDFSRNARQSIKKEQVVLLDVIQQTINDLKFGEGMEQIYVRLDVPRDYLIVTDLARLKMVLQNLIGNALKYSDPQKENQEVTVRVLLEGETTRIEITDNGVGIAEEYHPKIFEMFYRASEKSNGSGLGLYIVRETLARLNGTIQLKSVLGQGSTFTIWLPIQTS